ncbi:MAG: PQQ-binding-like beta-propeller repeat protein [Kiritimatiellia bacterium]|nr:PQQ-binding-like beta-propeller repeat protein [Kiritimatiellia bacterium]
MARGPLCLVLILSALSFAGASLYADMPGDLIDTVGTDAGIVLLVDPPDPGTASVLGLLRDTRFIVYYQSADEARVRELRREADSAGLLGSRLFVDSGTPSVIQVANNLADAVWTGPTAKEEEKEVLRVLRPAGTAFMGGRKIVKRLPSGMDDWSHPYHGPDNNPQSSDQLARGELRTQFIATPTFSPMPQQSVAAGGRVFRAFGHIAHRRNQNVHLNTLICVNAYNGVILWKRPLPEGFMIHRNTMVATDDAFYMGNKTSCQVIHAETGKLRDEITLPPALVDGPVWKWMAIADSTLYALVGNREIEIGTQRSDNPGLGHWPWGMWQGHDYKDPRTNFGFGRTLAAIDLKTRDLRWHLRTEEYIDARALCMNGTAIFLYSPGKFLSAVDRQSGKELWRETGNDLLSAIGPHHKAQRWVTGYATSCYTKCNDDYLYFVGPQRTTMVAVSARTGKLAWTHSQGNMQIVLRPDGIYAAGPQATGAVLDYKTGKVISRLPRRRACTRATGTIDSVFYRTPGGTVRVRTDIKKSEHIAAMRPPCQDGVLVANGHLYWGPWMCGCELSLYGHIALGPAGEAPVSVSGRHLAGSAQANLEPLGLRSGDWPCYRGDLSQSDFRKNPLPAGFKTEWKIPAVKGAMPTAPVAGGRMVFLGDRNGLVQGFDRNGKAAWKFYTGGPVYYPPALEGDRLFVGSADGCVYALESRSGRFLWKYRVAPATERIHVFNKLISRWPVAGGLAVRNGRVYAAAGIANYDGTHVVALDAGSGRLLAENRESGRLSPEVNGGVSLQGPLRIAGGNLEFVGGGVYPVASYDLKDLRCQNAPNTQLAAGTATAFYPYYPEYGKFVSLNVRCSAGMLSHAASYEGNSFGNLALQAAPDNPAAPTGEAARAEMRRRGTLKQGRLLWQDSRNRRFTAFIASDKRLIAAGHDSGKPFVTGIDAASGTALWEEPLPADTVKGGMAIDHDNRLFISLENGQLLCLTSDPGVAKVAAVDLPPPEKTRFIYIAGKSMKPFPRGTRHGKFPVQQSEDPSAPFSGEGVYFQQNKGQDKQLHFRVESKNPVREIHFKGAATAQMRMEILNAEGNLVLATSGPFREGNVYSEHRVAVPPIAGRRFILKFQNQAGTWFYIEKLTLR